MIVRKYRLQRGWSQQQLAQMAGVTARTIQRIEQGHRPSVETSKALASIFEMDFSSIANAKPEPNKEVEGSERILTNSPNLSYEEQEALNYAKRIKQFFEVSIGYLVSAIALIVLFQGNVAVMAIIGALGLCILIQGLIAFEIVGFLTPGYERKIAEKRLKRKL